MSSIPVEGRYKPAGNVLILNKHMRSRAQELQADLLGRWTWTKLLGKNMP